MEGNRAGSSGAAVHSHSSHVQADTSGGADTATGAEVVSRKRKAETNPFLLSEEDVSTIPRLCLEDMARAIFKGASAEEARKILENSYKSNKIVSAVTAAVAGANTGLLDNKRAHDTLGSLSQDIWLQKIFPFLGPGHFLYVTLVCKKFKQTYLEFLSKLEDAALPKVRVRIGRNSWCSRPAVRTSTFYFAAFSSASCAEFWDNSTNGGNNRLRSSSICQTIARYGNLEVLQWARGKGFPWNHQTCGRAAGAGHLEILKWALTNGCDWGFWTCCVAAINGHLEVLKWALENDCPGKERICEGAAQGGHLEVLKWARDHACPWDTGTCEMAAFCGHLEVLKWAQKHGCSWDGTTCSHAAYGGHLEILKWARENGCPWNARTCANAAKRGHLEVLKWAKENGCPCDEDTCSNAAKNGHLEVLKWAQTNQCPWNEEEVREAAQEHQGILDWLDGQEQ